MNYREFLSKIVKFKKVIELTNEPYIEQAVNPPSNGEDPAVDSPTQGTGNGISDPEGIEERIHINYRL